MRRKKAEMWWAGKLWGRGEVSRWPPRISDFAESPKGFILWRLYWEMTGSHPRPTAGAGKQGYIWVIQDWPLWGLEQPTWPLSLSLLIEVFCTNVVPCKPRLISVPRSSSLRVGLESLTRDYARARLLLEPALPRPTVDRLPLHWGLSGDTRCAQASAPLLQC